MNHLLQILLFLLTWLTTFANATPLAQKITISDYSISFSPTENQKLESEVKIVIQNFARSAISEKSDHLNATSRENYVLEESRARMSGEVVSGVGSVFNNFTKAIDFGGDILKNTGEKLNILGRAYPKNGTIGTKKLFDELIAKGIPETELTGLFKQMPKGVDEFGFDWDALSIIDQNTKYWNDFNKLHIDNIIANNGPIRFIHDPRLIENQYNVISQTAMDNFSVLARSQNIKQLPTFLKWEYDYLISKGYNLAENGLMIK